MKKLTSKQKADNALLWINRLATTSVKQGREQLGNSKEGYCCLGYGCKIMEIDYNFEAAYNEEFSESVGLKSSNGHFEEDFLVGNSYANSLVDLNDEFNYSFRKISTFIKKNVKYVFQDDVAKIILKKLNN